MSVIEGMARASIGKDYIALFDNLSPLAGPASVDPCDCIRIVIDDKEVVRKMVRKGLDFLADPQNITPEMVEAARETVHENQLINVHRDTVFKALTAALKAAMEE